MYDLPYILLSPLVCLRLVFFLWLATARNKHSSFPLNYFTMLNCSCTFSWSCLWFSRIFFSNKWLLMLINALKQVSACVSDIIWIAQVTFEFINSALLLYWRWFLPALVVTLRSWTSFRLVKIGCQSVFILVEMLLKLLRTVMRTGFCHSTLCLIMMLSEGVIETAENWIIALLRMFQFKISEFFQEKIWSWRQSISTVRHFARTIFCIWYGRGTSNVKEYTYLSSLGARSLKDFNFNEE